MGEGAAGLKSIFALLGVCLLGFVAAKAYAGAFPDGPGGPQIAVINASSLPDATVQADIPTFQAYADQVCAAWHCAGHLYFHPGPIAELNDWVMIVNDTSDIDGAIGYHVVCVNEQPEGCTEGQPVGYVSVATARKAKLGWPSVFTHELAEMLVDPEAARTENTANQCTFVGCYNGTFYMGEIADPVQGRSYRLGHLLVSDWVYRNWFIPGSPGPYDAARVLSQPLSLYYKDSYLSVYKDGSWTSQDSFKRGHRNWDSFGGHR